MKLLIYDANFNTKEDITQVMTWISFLDLQPTFFVRKFIFFLVVVVGKTIHIDMATMTKTYLSCTRVKVQVDF